VLGYGLELEQLKQAAETDLPWQPIIQLQSQDAKLLEVFDFSLKAERAQASLREKSRLAHLTWQ